MSLKDKLEIYAILQNNKNVSFKEAYLLEGLFGLGFRPFYPQ